MPLLTLRDISLQFSGPPLLDHINLVVEARERVALIGRNGEGKSTLLKVIAGLQSADDGLIQLGSTRVSYMTQDVPRDIHGSVFDVVAGGLDNKASLLTDYHHAVVAISTDASEAALDRLSRAQQALENADGWQLEQQVETVLSRLNLDPDVGFDTLSGGLRRRVLLARELVKSPDLLILDEPTNHLDIESIAWLEEFLLNWSGALLFVTHDRAFMQSLSTRILELDRGQLTDWPGDYQNYLRRREERANAEALENARFDKKLSQEEVWIRQGIKARRTRNEGRVRQLKKMREELSQRRTQQGSVSIRLQESDRSGKLVADVDSVSYAWDGKPVIRDFSTRILRGDKIGIIGPNGAGKSTLLNLLLGKIEPDSGTIQRGSNLEVAYFDQLRSALDLEKTVRDNVAGGSDQVEVNGKSRHIISYLQDFLFSPERVQQPAKALSGGERNRLLLAKLFTRPANVLVLDEPTNDLDIETLELLEELLVEYQGTILLVSHDRAFLDNVVTSTLVFEGDCRVASYVGGFEDWQRQRRSVNSAKTEQPLPVQKKSAAAKEQAKPAKLSYKDQRELEQLPALIESLEKKAEALQQSLADPALYRDRPDEVVALTNELDAVNAELETAYGRWEELDSH